MIFKRYHHTLLKKTYVKKHIDAIHFWILLSGSQQQGTENTHLKVRLRLPIAFKDPFDIHRVGFCHIKILAILKNPLFHCVYLF